MNKIFILVLLVVAALAGYLSLISTDVEFAPAPIPEISLPAKNINSTVNYVAPSLSSDSVETREVQESSKEDKILKGEKLLYFRNKEAYESFLRRAQEEGLEIIGQLDELKLVRIRFRRAKSERDFLNDFTDVDFISENDSLETPAPLIQHKMVGFRDHPLKYLGISGNEKWGAGVTIAVVDSGVVEHRSMKDAKIKHFNLLGNSEIISKHGTSVTSLIVGNSNHIKGIAPAANILDFRALSDEGRGDVFTVSQAIIMAVKNKARIINLSLGGRNDNPALQDAILYAQNAGALIVAAVGNEGAGTVSYPAAYPGVVGVGAIDAYENYQSFSNRGPEVDLVAPGVELKAAGLNETITYFTGTSAAAPLVSATLAYQLSQNPKLGNDELVEILKDNSNDSGFPGGDNLYGEGILNVRRIMDSGSSGVVDAAAAGFFLEPVENSNSFKLTFSGENRGTQMLSELQLSLSYPGFEKLYSFYGVEPSQTVFDYIEVPADSRLLNGDFELVLKTISKDGDRYKFNDVKSARIRLNAPANESE